MPMDGGWRVDNSLGVSNTPAVDLARTQQRFWVPSILNNGSATEWRQPRRAAAARVYGDGLGC